MKKTMGKGCYRCGSETHLAPECKFDGKCGNCGKEGHKATVCKKKESISKSVRSAKATETAVRVSKTKKKLRWGDSDSEQDAPGDWPDEWEEDPTIVRMTRIQEEIKPLSFWDAQDQQLAGDGSTTETEDLCGNGDTTEEEPGLTDKRQEYAYEYERDDYESLTEDDQGEPHIRVRMLYDKNLHRFLLKKRRERMTRRARVYFYSGSRSWKPGAVGG